MRIPPRESPYPGLIRRSLSIDRYAEQWRRLDGSLLGGSLLALRASVLLGPDDDGIYPIASHALDMMFGRRSIRALGRGASVANLARLLRQLGHMDPRRVVVLLAKSRCLSLMRDDEDSRVEIVPLDQIETSQPLLSMHRIGGVLVLPSAIGTRRSPIRFLNETDAGAKALVCKTADAHGLRYSGEQWTFAYVTDDRLDEARHARVSVPGVSQQRTQDGAGLTLEVPTLTVFQLSPRGRTQYTNMRMGMNFTPDGEHIAAVSTKSSDFDDFLDFYPNEFETALQGALRG